MSEDKKPLILVTNDDGVNAKGIRTLAEIASGFGEVKIVAPLEGQSGMSHAITIKNPLRVNKIELLDGIEIYGCNGTPVDSVKIALNKIFPQRPDLVLSGINHGSNSATSIIYSGTMAAAIEGCVNQIDSIGFSILDFDPNANFTHTYDYIESIIAKTLKKGLPKGICLNVNFPKSGLGPIKGTKICRQNNGYWKEDFDVRTDPYQREYYWLTGQYFNMEPEAKDTDEWALLNNYVSVVPVQIDFTSYKTMELLKTWKL